MFFLFFVVASCEKDEIELTQNSATSAFSPKIKVYDITKDDLENNPALMRKLKEIRFLEKNKANDSGKNVPIEGYGFTVVTDYGKYIEIGDHRSYTFLVVREEENGLLENLILTLEEDGTYSAVLLKYDLTESQIVQIQNNEQITSDLYIVGALALDGDFSGVLVEKVIYQAGGCLELVDITVTINDTCDYVYNFSFIDICNIGGGGDSGAGDGGDGSSPPGGSEGGGGAGSGSGDDGGDPPPEDCHGDCGPEIITIFVLPEEEEEDTCEKIATQIADPDFQAKVGELEDNTDLQYETGYSQSTDGSFTGLDVGLTVHQLDIPITSTLVGVMHVHLDDYQADCNVDGVLDTQYTPTRMFSPGDIISFFDLLLNAQQNNLPLSDVFYTMISSNGNYTLRFTGDISDVHTNFDIGVLNEAYRIYFDKYSQNEKALLHFMNEEIGIDGISLFEIKNNGTVKEKTLNANGNVESETCP
ncbi:MAG TPA: hypothetical protein VFM65_06610 [Flavobacteriaceae bacterium]|nr:hypothetical protein [Flavobacteriaceae bacterium]